MAKLLKTKKVVGWCEWISLPELEIPWLKVKVDTGAKTSALHAFDIKRFQRSGEAWIDFSVHPLQNDDSVVVEAEAPVLTWRHIKSSNGIVEERPVVLLDVCVMEETWPIEVTLTNRDEMGFRMLLGREAMKGRLVVDPGKRYLAEKPSKRRK